MGNGAAARHYAIINASRVKRLLRDGLKDGLTDAEKEKLGLDKDPDPVTTTTTTAQDTPPTATSSQAAENQSTAQSVLDDLADPTSEAAINTANIVAASNTGGPSGAANQAETIKNLNQITQNLETATQNPSGQISLKDGGLASKPKKKKNKK